MERIPPENLHGDSGIPEDLGRHKSDARGDMKESVGGFIRMAREEQRLSQEQVSLLTQDLGETVSRTTLSDIERGVTFPSLDALSSLSQVLRFDPGEVLERVRTFVAPVDITDLDYDRLKQRAESCYWDGDYRQSLSLYDAAYERLLLEDDSDSQERKRRVAETELHRAIVLRRLGALRAAKLAAERAVEGSNTDRELQAKSYICLGSLQSIAGYHTLARISIDQVTSQAESFHAELQSDAWSQQGAILFRLGDYAAARAAFLEARKQAKLCDDDRSLAGIEGNLGACLLQLGDTAHAERHFVEAIKLARSIGDTTKESFLLVGLGEVALSQGDWNKAEQLAGESLRLSRPRLLYLTMFRGEWLGYQARRRDTPSRATEADTKRLKKLYPRVKAHRGFGEILEFEREVLQQSGGQS